MTPTRPHQAAPVPPAFLSIRDFTRYSGLGRSRVYELIKAGELETIKYGRRRLIPMSAAATWANDLMGQHQTGAAL
jgi:excisionase family DNA binding protein